MKIAYEANAWGGVIGTPGAVTDLGSGFYLTPGDVEAALDAIAAAGFTGVEVFDGNLLPFEATPERFAQLLSARGLELAGVYSGGHLIYRDAHEDELARFRRSIALAAECGAQHYVVGGGAIRSTGRRDDDYAAAAELLSEVTRTATAAGLVASYHPHLGSLAQSPEQIDSLLAASDIALCADVAHIAAGGGDPAAVIRRYADRLALVHMKDLDRASGAFLPLGDGDLDLAAVASAVHESGYDGWITVELDGYEGDLDAAAARSRRFLDEHRLAP